MAIHSTAMSHRHHAHWPEGLPHRLTVPQTSLFHNVEVSAARYPDKPFIVFYDTVITFAAFQREAECIAGYLQQRCGVKKGDRVLLYMQNSPQCALAYYGILRADAVVVPVNPMNLTQELRHYIDDTGATTALVAQDLLDRVMPLITPPADGATGLQHLIVATYSDYLHRATDLDLPDFVAAPRQPLPHACTTAWVDMLALSLAPGPSTSAPDDLCVLPYTSGTTGLPRGCMHTHRSAMSALACGVQWFSRTQDAVYLSVLPFFHVTGMAGSLNGPLFIGATIVLLPRWNRDAAAQLIERYRVTAWQVISTMVVDFVANPQVSDYDLSSLHGIRGGGAAMPPAVAEKLKALTGVDYVEGYGLSETMAATHINPPHRPKPQCLGIPVFDVDARVVDPQTLAELAVGDIGEIVLRAPQLMVGYWNDETATAKARVEIGGQRYFRTGDLAYVDEDGYFFMVDRLKRMINAAGYKVWPAEVEALMYRHPAILEACVIASLDARRGETVKALVVLKPEHVGHVDEQDIIGWARDHMAAYKIPRVVAFVAALPKSGSGKVQWRALQEDETRRTAGQQGATEKSAPID